MHVRKIKRGTPATHPILGDELRGLRRVQREQEPGSPFVFVSERGASFTTAGFSRIVERAGAEAKLGFKAHPHRAQRHLDDEPITAFKQPTLIIGQFLNTMAFWINGSLRFFPEQSLNPLLPFCYPTR